MRVIRREWFDTARGSTFKIIPMADWHLGAAACNELRLIAVRDGIRDDPDCYWVGLGDICEFINVRDRRFDAAVLADWITVADLTDLASAQIARAKEIIKPIASKCLGMIEGNHERTMQAHFERSVYSELVTFVKQAGGFAADFPMALSYYGWLQMLFYRAADKQRCTTITANIHHGFTGGRLDGGKALNMQRWLWTHDADVTIFGHGHNTMAQKIQVEGLDTAGHLVQLVRRGCYGGTFLNTVNEDGPSTYSEIKGYLPLPIGGCEIRLSPGAEEQYERVHIVV